MSEEKTNDMLKHVRRLLSPANFLLLILLPSALLTVAVTPPLQVPDGDMHFCTCYNLSRFSTDYEIPDSLWKFCMFHSYLVARPEQKYSMEKLKMAAQFHPEPDEAKTECHGLLYNFIPSYLPSVIAMGLTRLFTENYLVLLYAGRIAIALTYSILAFLAVRTMPCDKWILALLLALPSSVFQSALISYDGMTLAVSALWAAFLFRDLLCPPNPRITWGLAVSSFVLCWMKAPYPFVIATVCLLFFQKRYRFLILPGTIAILFMIMVTATMMWAKIQPMSSMETPSVMGNMDLRITDASELQKLRLNEKADVRILQSTQATHDFLYHNSFESLPEKLCRFPGRFIRTMFSPERLMIYAGSFLGCLGWLDTLLPPVLLLTYFLVIVFMVATAENSLPFARNIVPLCAGFCMAFGIFLIFGISYLPYHGTIPGIVGRYFLPCSFFMAFALRFNGLNRYCHVVMKIRCFLPPAAMFVIQTTMLVTLLQRYYFDYWWDRSM